VDRLASLANLLRCHRAHTAAAPGIRTHQLVLPPSDIRARLGIRVTSPARTALDCAPALDHFDLRRLVNNLRVREPSRLSDREIADIVERNPRHPGAKRLAWFIDQGVSESELEDLLFPWCDAYDVPRPQTQVEFKGFRLDAVYLDEKLVLELDGWESHRGREAFESDRDRDATLAEYGFIVIRITWWRFEHDPAREARRLLRILAQRRGLLAA
jgi:very-short-patch-repair endonuclease